MEKMKRAILIAAGEGSRLRPVTLQTPKPLVKVNGKRIIETSIDALFQNGIEDIYIVVGYKSEQFEDLFGNDPRIHLIKNENYLKGNNITSMYLAREYLPESFVLEADIMIRDAQILSSSIEKSGYVASWEEPVAEWLLEVENDKIKKCIKDERKPGYQLWGISMWNKTDGEKLADLIEEQYLSGRWDIYWDEIALFQKLNDFDMRIRKINRNALQEVDTFQELVQLDSSYSDFI